ncbi:MFS transporter [Siccirubricoccus sp. KC 17139]|uniref:MFS transporter n=1 Tax=Siccirubricoccus soli TaxID=2899147 RepID=A0ABT1D7Y6_9PROT|nr:MFS transporter [Siccirubricoccus soli]MCP2684156.1 MFS transporter [Siccirubricoccus soli]
MSQPAARAEEAAPGDAAPSASDTRLLWGIALGQTIGWGTLYYAFPLFGAPLEAELGWSRAAFNAGLTLSLLVSGLAAIPVGRMVDRSGGRRMVAWGAGAGALLLLAWAGTSSLPVFWGIWLLMGLAHAASLWAPAMAVVVAMARDPARTITGITFVTGFTATIFTPLTALLIEGLGWRGALLALAALQAVVLPLTLWLLPAEGERPSTAPRPGFSLWQAVRRPAFLQIAACFAALSFVSIGLTAHVIPMLRERGLAEPMVILIVSLHGPFQVAARALLFALGKRVTMRGVGKLATLLTPCAMLVLALAPPALLPFLLYALLWAMADGLMTIVRAAGVAEILGREAYGTITGALTMLSLLPRTLAPLAIALLWEGMGGYGPVPWLLAGLGCVAAATFFRAAR